jgi:(2R)-3-sulfolactate dehydrogenase (NADP+)
MAPAGGYKGALAGAAGRCAGRRAGGAELCLSGVELRRNEGGPPDVGQFLLAISPQAFGGTSGFADRLEVMLSALAQDDGVRLPGDGRYAHRKVAEADGIEVPQDLIDTLQAYA